MNCYSCSIWSFVFLLICEQVKYTLEKYMCSYSIQSTHSYLCHTKSGLWCVGKGVSTLYFNRGRGIGEGSRSDRKIFVLFLIVSRMVHRQRTHAMAQAFFTATKVYAMLASEIYAMSWQFWMIFFIITKEISSPPPPN